MRVAIGGLSHETNQYVPTLTEVTDFDVARGAEIMDRYAGRTYVGGMVAAAAAYKIELVGTYHALAQPSGTIAGTTYTSMKADLLDAISEALPLDGVVLELHGAAVAEGVDDVEGDVCAVVRSLVGRGTPLVIAHDLHGNITHNESCVTDAMFSVRHYPHDDMFDCGYSAMEAVARMRSNGRQGVIHVEKLPMIIPTSTTYFGPGARALAVCSALRRRRGVNDCIFMHGFPYADHPHVGASVLVLAEEDAELAAATAKEAAASIWELREEFLTTYPTPEEAIRQALATDGSPVVINETSDNPGGGAPGDGTHLLRAILDARLERALFVGLRDAEVVQVAHRAGEGATIDVALGAKTHPLHGRPIRCRAFVKSLAFGDVVLEAPMGRGWRYPLGLTAHLIIGGVDVLVISERRQTIDLAPLKLHNLNPYAYKVIALKSSHHFRSGFQKVAAAIITTDPPGLTTTRLGEFPRRRTEQSLFPLESDAVYPVRARVESV